MGEELLQITPKPLGRYLFYRIGSTTLGQLKKQKIIRASVPSKISNKKPDCLVVLPGGDVKAIIEYKQPSELKTKAQVNKAIQQEIEVAKQFCKLLIVTSGKKTIWINALNGERIIDENGAALNQVFDAKPIENMSFSNEEAVKTESLIDKIDHSLTSSNNKIASPELLDPSILARTIWQKIWINTGKEPEKCLYNVVELFLFKFLSDVGVLRAHNNFGFVYNLSNQESAAEALKHYANNCRREIRELFPEDKEDKTTIINGTIFVNEQGDPNIAQASLFGEVLQHLQDYDSEFGSFKYIKKEFKTRLYESFLRKSAGIGFLGQYFTPRNVVNAIVSMSGAEHLKKGSRVCDPFCGVGGFLLELIALNNNVLREFEPKNGVVSPNITLVGYDKGSDEKEDERTIILAKANMLIYFSDLLVKYNSRKNLKAFSDGAFNKVFRLLRSNLGTFGRVDDESYDLILTNPPYVTSGSSSLKRAIENEGLSNHYTSGGRGTEALAMEWIVNNLNDDGMAFVVVPDGLLNQEIMLTYLKAKCVIQGVVSLPVRTFYSTPKKTYILALKKKNDVNIEQATPVFTYLINEIGETRDAKRFDCAENDLIEMASLFNQFKGAQDCFVSTSTRCKIVDYESFSIRSNWMVDRWWSKAEKLEFDIADEPNVVSELEFQNLIIEAGDEISNLILELSKKHSSSSDEKRLVRIDSAALFDLKIGNRILKKDILESGIPAYSANVNSPFGYTNETNIKDFSQPTLIWGIDGNFDWGFIPMGVEFSTTDHCGSLRVLSDKLHPEYIFYVLKNTKEKYGFDRTYRASLKNIKDVVEIEVPVNSSGEFDLVAQKAIASRYEKLEHVKRKALEQLELLASVDVSLDK